MYNVKKVYWERVNPKIRLSKPLQTICFLANIQVIYTRTPLTLQVSFQKFTIHDRGILLTFSRGTNCTCVSVSFLFFLFFFICMHPGLSKSAVGIVLIFSFLFSSLSSSVSSFLFLSLLILFLSLSLFLFFPLLLSLPPYLFPPTQGAYLPDQRDQF